VERLEALRDELQGAHPKLKVHLEPCDLADVAAAARFLDGLSARAGDIDVLINNAGVGDFGPFDRADWKRTEALIALNVTSVALLTHRLVPPMVARRRGGVLNISSGYGFAFSPWLATYVGSKHFVTGFTESLRLDLSGTGVVVSQCCPGPVATEFEAVAAGEEGTIPKWAMISAAACARAAMRGFERGRAMIVPGALMKFLRFLVAVSPRFMQRLVQAPLARRFRKAADHKLLSAGRE
jgi:short-subunit dehydrogenase